ncbi:hypothetical protein CEXT_597461 [Caerostris extrusa]|uniref:Uncharacterized protein n=1 Tax=Caerostris extrusa TaxID=172846 RepID=A0AAV4WEM9_CAEEX|nr:hypothetical protein CEXT_597461 [Caerostris extrusa]
MFHLVAAFYPHINSTSPLASSACKLAYPDNCTHNRVLVPKLLAKTSKNFQNKRLWLNNLLLRTRKIHSHPDPQSITPTPKPAHPPE